MLIANQLQMIYKGGLRALHNVSFAATGIVGLVGPNGAGKSTLMRILVGIQEPSGGDVSLDGTTQSDWVLQTRQRIGYLPQDFGLYPEATAKELLAHFAVLKGYARKHERTAEVERVLAATNLTSVGNRRLGGFSGGMRQRFGLAQAILGMPRFLAIDEPTAGLDPDERYRLLNLISGLAQNTVVILSTHIVQDVSDLCSRMLVLNGGCLVDDVKPHSAIEALRGRVWRVISEPVRRDNAELPYRILSNRLVGGQVVSNCLSSKRPNDNAVLIEPTLEDYYFARLSEAGLGDSHVG